MKRALVVSGGGSKGAFAVGVIRQLANDFPRLNWEVYVGTSTGALLTPLAAMKEYDLLEELYTTQHTEDIIIKQNIGNRLNENSIYDANPLWNLITEYYTDTRFDELIASGNKIYLNTVCLQTRELVVFTNDEAAKNGRYYQMHQLVNAEQFRRAVMASACQPFFMPPVKVNRHVPGEAHPHYQYLDGGIREYVGVQMAIDAGAIEILTVLLSPETVPAEEKEYKTLLEILERTIDIFSADVGKNDLLIPAQYNEALQYISGVKTRMLADGIPANKLAEYFSSPGHPFTGKEPLKLFMIRPNEVLAGGPGGLVFHPSDMMEMVAKGRTSFQQFVAGLPPEDLSGWS